MGSTDDPSVLARQVPYVEGRHYIIDGESGCWNWTGHTLRDGSPLAAKLEEARRG